MADYNESRNRSRIDYPNDDAVHTRRVTADEIAHRNTYVRGRNSQEIRHHDRQIRDINHHIDQERIDRDRNKTAIGLLLGIALASAIGLLAAIFYFASRKDEARIIPVPAPTVQPQNTNQPASSQPQSTQGTTIIERLREVPVPQTEVEPAPTQQQPPQQQIVVPAPTNAPATAPTAPNTEAPSQSTVTPQQPAQQSGSQGSNSQVQNDAASTNVQPSGNTIQPQNEQPQQDGQDQSEAGAQSGSSEANSYQIEIPNQ